MPNRTPALAVALACCASLVLPYPAAAGPGATSERDPENGKALTDPDPPDGPGSLADADPDDDGDGNQRLASISSRGNVTRNNKARKSSGGDSSDDSSLFERNPWLAYVILGVLAVALIAMMAMLGIHCAKQAVKNNRHQRGRGYEELHTPPSTPPKGGEEKPGAAESLSDCNRKSIVIEPILDDGVHAQHGDGGGGLGHDFSATNPDIEIGLKNGTLM